MTIVLNEHEWARDMIDSGSLGKKPFETLCRVARYYYDENYSKRNIRRMLETFLLKCDPTASITKWSDAIDYAVSRASKTKAINIQYIGISDSELKVIQSISGKQLQRLAFTLLALSKYWDSVNPNGDHWVNAQDSDIMKMANINTSIKRQSQMYHTLCEMGLIQFSKKVDNTNVRVLFGDSGTCTLKITDFRNIGYQYIMHTGSDDYIQCQNCGVVVKRTGTGASGAPRVGRPQKYCKDCASEIRIRQSVNSVMKRRSNSSACRSDVSVYDG